MKYFLCLALLFLCPSGVWAQEAETPPAVNGTVTLSLDRFLQLTRTGPATPAVAGGPAAPVTHLFPQGDYRVSVEDCFARVEADLKLSVYGQGWVSVDLLASPVVLESAHLDGQPLLTQASEEGGLKALVHRTGSHQLRLVYYLPLTNAGPSRSFALLTPASAVSRLRLVVPGKTRSPAIPRFHSTMSKNWAPRWSAGPCQAVPRSPLVDAPGCSPGPTRQAQERETQDVCPPVHAGHGGGARRAPDQSESTSPFCATASSVFACSAPRRSRWWMCRGLIWPVGPPTIRIFRCAPE